MKRPVVSVLLPAYNAAATLGLTLRSIQRQSLTDFECIVVDDGSRDETPELVRALSRIDQRFQLIEGCHRGIVPALNSGLLSCRGKYIARMDADDVAHRQRLKYQVELLEAEPSLCGVGCRVRLFPRRSLTDGMQSYERWLNAIDSPERVRAEAFVECPVAHPTLVLRRAVLVEAGYRDQDWPEDYDLVLRLLGSGQKLGVVTQRLLAWRDSPERLSRVAPSYSLSAIVRCKAHFLAQDWLRDASEYVLWGYGKTGRAVSRALMGHGKHPTLIVELHPGRLGQRIHGAPVVPPSSLPNRLGERKLVVSVAGQSARDQIRAALGDMGFRERVHYVCAA